MLCLLYFLRYLLWNGIIFCNMSHDTWCPHSSMTTQKVPYLAPFCPQILAGALCQSMLIQLGSNIHNRKGSDIALFLLNSLTMTLSRYRNNPNYLDRLPWANTVDPDQMLQIAASDCIWSGSTLFAIHPAVFINASRKWIGRLNFRASLVRR